MFRLRACSLSIGLALFSSIIAVAAPPLTTVQDILYNADGTRFEGIATISWQSFQAVDSTTIGAKTITTHIVNGFFRVQLVPTSNAITPASYTVTYNTAGNSQFAESWIVPPSNVPVRIRDVRIGPAGTVVGGTPVPPLPVTSVQITDVIGLAAALNIRPSLGTGFTPSRAAVINSSGGIDGALGSLSDCLHVDGSAAPCGALTTITTVFVDGEIPSGATDGANQAFALALAPNPPASLQLYRNGLLQTQGTEYTLTSMAIAFTNGHTPVSGDILVASYRAGGAISGVTFVDAEVPAGAIDGVNLTYVLTQAPSPAASLEVYRNGLRLRMNLDYTNSGKNVVFQAGLAPQSGDVLQVSYRVSQ